MAATGEKVDVIAEAYEQARRESTSTYAGAIKVIAPAKVNLYLGVGQRRADGYHDVCNIMHAIMLHDVLYVKRERDGFADDGADTHAGLQVETTCVGFDGIDVPECSSEKNLATRAVRALAQATGNDVRDERISIRIEKHVPHQAGLGGGSSDAAAALKAACQLWDVDPASPEVVQVAAKLGADVAFFLEGGCARFEGVGEKLAARLAPRKGSVVLVKPDGGLSTADVYRTFDYLPAAAPAHEGQAIAAQAADDVELFNGLAPAAESLMPQLAEVRELLAAQPGCTGVLLCGSGAATFACFDTFAQANAAATVAKSHGWWAYATSFAPIGTAIAG